MVVGFEDPSPIIAPIEEIGGCVVNVTQFQGVADYAVVPLDGTPEKFSAMETVTVLWIVSIIISTFASHSFTDRKRKFCECVESFVRRYPICEHSVKWLQRYCEL